MAEEIVEEMQRQTNIELLRCLAMVGVVFLHASNYPYQNIPDASIIDKFLITLFHSICWGSVNVLVLISGYFTIHSKSGRFFKFRKMTHLYLQMWFYSFLFFFISRYYFHQDASLTPLKSGTWWFMSEYFKLMLLAPIIVRGMAMMNRQQYLCIILLFVVMFGFFHIQPDGGFGVLWFVTLFLVGGYLNRYHPMEKISMGGVSFIYILNLFLFLINRWLRSFMPLTTFPISYDNLLVLIMSVCLLEMFRRLIIENNLLVSIVRFIAPLTLGVYLIHTHPSVHNFIWSKFACFFPEKHFVTVLGGTIVLFLICIIVDFLRSFLFKIMRINILVNNCLDGMKAKISKMKVFR